jgi:hypothetical protein
LVELDPEAEQEIVTRLMRLHDLSAELAEAYDDPVMKKGAEEMRDSLERVLELLGRGTTRERRS